MGERPVREECKEPVFYTIDCNREELMELIDGIKGKRRLMIIDLIMSEKPPLQRCGGARDDTTIHINFSRRQLMALLHSIAQKHPRECSANKK